MLSRYLPEKQIVKTDHEVAAMIARDVAIQDKLTLTRERFLHLLAAASAHGRRAEREIISKTGERQVTAKRIFSAIGVPVLGAAAAACIVSSYESGSRFRAEGVDPLMFGLGTLCAISAWLLYRYRFGSRSAGGTNSGTN